MLVTSSCSLISKFTLDLKVIVEIIYISHDKEMNSTERTEGTHEADEQEKGMVMMRGSK